MDKIFVLKKGKYITGPYSLAQLVETGLKENDKIWYEGMADWQEASSLSVHNVTVSPEPPAKASKPWYLFK